MYFFRTAIPSAHFHNNWNYGTPFSCFYIGWWNLRLKFPVFCIVCGWHWLPYSSWQNAGLPFSPNSILKFALFWPHIAKEEIGARLLCCRIQSTASRFQISILQYFHKFLWFHLLAIWLGPWNRRIRLPGQGLLAARRQNPACRNDFLSYTQVQS